MVVLLLGFAVLLPFSSPVRHPLATCRTPSGYAPNGSPTSDCASYGKSVVDLFLQDIKTVTLQSRWIVIAMAASLGAGCASLPSGPSILALPGTGKTFDEFRLDDDLCRRYASAQVGGVGPNQAANDTAVRNAALGTVIGAVAGAAIGGNQGASVGAGTGLLFGTMAGSAAASSGVYGSQRSYDHAYIQCMYGRGQRVPVVGATRSVPQNQAVVTTQSRTMTYVVPAAGGAMPPPPSGMPPPPPGLPPPPPPGAFVR